jgi:hypothetical protein
MAWWEFDPTYWTVKVMQMVGLAHSIKEPKRVKAMSKPIAPQHAEESNPEPEPAVVS